MSARCTCALAAASLFLAACTPAQPDRSAEARPASQNALDSAAAWRAPLGPELYHGLRGWIFRPGDSTPIAAGPRGLVSFAPGLAPAALDTLAENQLLSFSPDGTHLGRMQREGELVARFELRTTDGKTVWAHGARGHHFYQIGPGARLVAGFTSSTRHPGKPGSVGTVTLYGAGGEPTGRFACAMPGGSEIAPDAGAILIECRDSALVLLDPRAQVLAALPGSYRSFRVADAGRVVAAVPVARPRELVVLQRDSLAREARPRSRELPAPIRQVALTPDGGLIVATAGAEVVGLGPDPTADRWRVRLEGEPAITSLAVGRDGLVAVGAIRGPVRAGDRAPRPATVAAIRDGKVVRSVDFELESPNAWVPSVALAPEEHTLLVWDPSSVWSISLPRWLNR